MRCLNIKYIRGIVIAIILMFFYAASSFADIYRYVDKQGVTHFTNIPTSSLYRPYLRTGKIPYSSKRYDRIINQASKKYGVSFSLVKAIIMTESAFNPRAVSKKGAVGLMQIMPQNFKTLKITDPFDPYQNIMGGTMYFKGLLKRFNGKLSFALAGYNAGPNRVDQYNGIPPYAETRGYVKKVMRYYRVLKSKS
ncbi:lytic transglycosylase domain-containing protein [Desulfobacterales bacterium HSG16]|nr:lytic transglycosylase domain-containing protein [Desulfobacterales bacterium HSG16]